ncbi:MAG: hypothetical protein ASARMPREDX12_001115 [Alectoria sarmentosa]|nr:MAG: hypothetical protein ASARMPREDX12_001115 [Alectoria sarmentosa]
MVVFVDLDNDVSDDPHADLNGPRGFSSLRQHRLGHKVTANAPPNSSDGISEERPNPNINSFSAALGAYPIVTQLAHSVDLNTIDALARTCRQIRANLLQYRNRLVQQTLHCENEFRDAKLSESEKPGQKWHILGEAGHLVSGKVSTCARDLVSDCRRTVHTKPLPPRTSPPAIAASAPPAFPPPSPSSPPPIPPLAPAQPASTSAPLAVPLSQPQTPHTAASGHGARGKTMLMQEPVPTSFEWIQEKDDIKDKTPSGPQSCT